MFKSTKAMKSLLASVLCLTMVFGLTACGETKEAAPSTAGTETTAEATGEATETADASLEGPCGIKYAADQTLRLVYDTEASSLKTYGGEGTAVSWQALSNCVAGLVSKDCYGNYVGDMATSWDISEDGTVYTFHLRDDMVWSDVDGEDMGPITAQDFVTGLQFCANADNGVTGTNFTWIKGFDELVDPENPENDMETLGFKALDDYTIEITLKQAIPYFIDYCGGIMPVPTDYFNEMGESYGMDNESIYYCGPYIMTTFDPQSQRVYEVNPNYWDKENVFIQKIVMIYNAEAATLAPEMFKRGEIDFAAIGTDILDEWMTAEDTKDIVVPALPDTTYMYYYSFCYDPQFGEEYDPENYRLAINNENFRKSLYFGLDRQKAYLCLDPYNPDQFLTNSVTPRTWCSINGTDFVDLPAMQEITARPNFSFDADAALSYKEKAVEELTAAGATFPITLYMPYNPNTLGWDKEVQVVKQQLEGLLGTDYINCVIETGPSEGFLTEVRRSGKYGFMKLNNGSTESDPCAWIKAFEEGKNWNFLDLAQGEDIEKCVQEYYALLEKGRSYTNKCQERYDAFAEAEAYLLDHAIVIPYAKDTLGYHVTRYNPLEAIYGTDMRFKYVHVLEEPLTAEQYNELYAIWQEEQKASLK